MVTPDTNIAGSSIEIPQKTFHGYNPPEIPNKYEIIPIHQSDRGNFKRCRRYWDWNSPARQNLTVRADINGINTNFFFGTGIHWALEQFYNPILSRDPVEAWKTWFDIQWRGGIVTEEWLDLVYDLAPQSTNEYISELDGGETPIKQLWKVRGLEDILPDPDHNIYDEMFELGINMMQLYKQFAAKNDDFQVYLTEHTYSVPIWDYENNKILTAIDTRQQSPNYGKELEVHARGRTDAILQRYESDRLAISDYKTAGTIGDDYFRKLETDEQITQYLWAIEIEANYYDLPHKGKSIEEVIYTVLRKAYPKPPTEIRGGMFSVNRAEESCTYEMLIKWIGQNMPGVPLTEKQENYVEYLKELGDEQFIIRKFVRRNRHQIANMGERMYLEAMDMLQSNVRIYPNLTNNRECMNCQFRAPCLAQEDGGDYLQLIEDNYARAKDR